MERTKNNLWIFVAGFGILTACFAAGFLLLRGNGPDSPEAGAGGPRPDQPAGAVAVEAPAGKDPNVAYENDFSGEPGPEWNRPTTKRTKKGDRPYLGDFLPGSKPTLSLKSLPPHKLVRLTFDLFLFKSWDGSSPMWGPGLMDVSVGGDDGRSLLHATFGNCGFFSDNNEQSFPDNFPARPYEAWTLAMENQSLGTEVSWGGPDRTFDASSAYHMVYTFPHAAPEIEVEFASTLPDNPNKPFGLTNVKVETLPELAKFSSEEFAKLWADLGSGNAKTFYEARWKLVSAGDAAADYIFMHYKNLDIPENPKITAPGGHGKPYPMEAPVIHRERARWVLEAIHTPLALEVKKGIPTIVE